MNEYGSLGCGTLSDQRAIYHGESIGGRTGTHIEILPSLNGFVPVDVHRVRTGCCFVETRLIYPRKCAKNFVWRRYQVFCKRKYKYIEESHQMMRGKRPALGRRPANWEAFDRISLYRVVGGPVWQSATRYLDVEG